MLAYRLPHCTRIRPQVNNHGWLTLTDWNLRGNVYLSVTLQRHKRLRRTHVARVAVAVGMHIGKAASLCTIATLPTTSPPPQHTQALNRSKLQNYYNPSNYTLLGNIPYYFTLYFLQEISTQPHSWNRITYIMLL
jgi:hypothetical protein